MSAPAVKRVRAAAPFGPAVASFIVLAVGLVFAAAPTDVRTVRVSERAGFTTELSLDAYVARVLAGEAAQGSTPAALEALAITVRTFAVANLGRHRADGFDFCNDTHCQVFRPSTAATERAARATTGQVLLYRGSVASVYYSASCGGRTERPSDVWPGADDPPYLPIHNDEACEHGPMWTDDIQAADLQRTLASGGFSGQLRSVDVAGRDSSGRVQRLALGGMTPSEISGQDLRMAVSRTLGQLHIKSAQFDVGRTANIYHFAGRGSGHGVGLCVIGSANLAAAGKSVPQILAQYFPGLQISSTSTPAGSVPPRPLPFPMPARRP